MNDFKGRSPDILSIVRDKQGTTKIRFYRTVIFLNFIRLAPVGKTVDFRPPKNAAEAMRRAKDPPVEKRMRG